MSETGRTARDVLLGLMKTYAKPAVSFFRYLGIPDSIAIPAPADLLRQAACA